MSPNSQAVQVTLERFADPPLDDVIDATIRKLQDRSGGIEVSNFDLTDPADYAAALLMDVSKQNKIFSMTDGRPLELHVKYLMVREAQQWNKSTQEIEGKLRTVIVDDSDNVWATNSPVVSAVALRLLSSKATRKKFDPPVTVTFERIATLQGGAALHATLDRDTILRLTQGQ